MTATARLFREVLSDRALTHSSAAEARQIVERAEQAVEHYKTEIAQRTPSGTQQPVVKQPEPSKEQQR